MTKTEEALCNGITFSVPRLVPYSIQEGEQEDAKYYVYALITPTLDKLVLKIYYAPSYEVLEIDGKKIDGITYDLYKNELDGLDANEVQRLDSYDFGDNSGIGSCAFQSGGRLWIRANSERVYNGLMLYPGLKCIIIRTIESIIRRNEENDGEQG